MVWHNDFDVVLVVVAAVAVGNQTWERHNRKDFHLLGNDQVCLQWHKDWLRYNYISIFIIPDFQFVRFYSSVFKVVSFYRYWWRDLFGRLFCG